MNIEELKVKSLKQRCIQSIDKERQLEEARNKAKDRPMEMYHRGRKEVWLEVHDTIVRWF